MVGASGLVAEPSSQGSDSTPMSYRSRGIRWSLIEGSALVSSPLLAFYLLHLRAMAPDQVPDPTMHTSYILQPRSMFLRYAAALSRDVGLREAARVGFLVPARVDYLIFGALPGFFVTRYALALVAVVPVYLLLRRLYGLGAGAVGVVVIFTCPVVITAWGTDYPDSAVVSYLAGALACLAMPCDGRWRRAWIATAAGLFTLAVWSHGIGAVLSGVTLLSYGLVRLVRDRRHLVSDVSLVAGVAVVVTAGLSVASELVLGHFDFFLPTWAAYRYLSRPAQVAIWHSRNWRWITYDSYLIVPPAVVGAFVAAFARRKQGGGVPTPQLIVGAAAICQIGILAYLQFFGGVQTLEIYYFSSALWGALCVALALCLAQFARPLLHQRWLQWLPVVALVAVALAYEAYPHVPAFGWFPYGALLGALVVLVALGARAVTGGPVHAGGRLVAVAAVVALAGGSLVLTVAGAPPHRQLRGTVHQPPAPYASALGGSAGTLLDQYRVTAELPQFVGPATYPGEQLLTWSPRVEFILLVEPRGLFRASDNALQPSYPLLSPKERAEVMSRRPAEILLFSLSGVGFATALRSLHPFAPALLRRTVLSSGTFHLHVWLIRLDRFARYRST